jgi:hypothetical protein
VRAESDQQQQQPDLDQDGAAERRLPQLRERGQVDDRLHDAGRDERDDRPAGGRPGRAIPPACLRDDLERGAAYDVSLNMTTLRG